MRRSRTVAFLAAVAVLALFGAPARGATAPSRPNILWITCEDISPNLRCYGDAYATTPSLDRFAARGLIYRHCWSNAPVCAPARTTIITGVYPTSSGAVHMRSRVPMPGGIRMFPQILREAGYYCTNNRKEDYNLLASERAWDESSGKAHWRNWPAGKPFFAVFNLTVTHESQIGRPGHTLVHDPAKAPLPSYYPDTPEIRRDVAQYYDNITTMDGQFAERLDELRAAGLEDDTIVFFYGDHGAGLPRHKRCACESGLATPLIVHVPERFRGLASHEYRAGGATDRLVSFVDLAPTVLSLAGIPAPAWMQGRAFLGRHEAAPRDYLHGFRGRMGARYDLVRSVRDQRFVYVRNYMPQLPQGRPALKRYAGAPPSERAWKRLFDEGKLSPVQARYWQPRPAEQLYDLSADPDEVNNLADSPAHQAILARLRKAQQEQIVAVHDVGFLPEAEMHRRAQGTTPYDMARDPQRYPLSRVVGMAELASRGGAEVLTQFRNALDDADPAVRYWAAMGILIHGRSAVAAAPNDLRRAMADDSPDVRIVAAQSLAQYGRPEDCAPAVAVLADMVSYKAHGIYVSQTAMNALELLGDKAWPALDAVRAIPAKLRPADARVGQTYLWMKEELLSRP